MMPPTEEDVARSELVHSRETGSPPYDFHRKSYYRHPDGRWLRVRESAHLDADWGTTTSLDWVEEEEVQDAMTAAHEAAEREPPPVAPSKSPKGEERGNLVVLAFFAILALLAWLIAERWF